MKTSELQEWANSKGAINPVVEEEVLHPLMDSSKEERTGRRVHTYVFPSGRVIGVYCDKEDTIVEVRGEVEAPVM